MFVAVLLAMLRWCCFAIVMSAAVARAQPAPPARQVYPASYFAPLDASGWPNGLSVDDLRELPECGVEGIKPIPGAAVTCRPPIIVGGPQWGLSFDWTSGGTFGGPPTIGGAQGLGVEVDFSVMRSLQLGARYELMGVGVPSNAMFNAGTFASNQFLAIAKHRFFTDEVRRNAWTFGVGGGYAIRGETLGGSAPIVRGSIAREIGLNLGESSAMTTAIELSYEQSLGPQKLSAILANLRFGFEVNVREPEGLGHPAPVPWRHTTSFEVFAGPFLGFGATLGLRAAPYLSLETSGGFLFGFTRDGKEHGIDGASWSLQSGPRLLLPWPADYVPLYLQVQGGAAWVSQDPRGELRAIATGELGFHAFVGCGSAVDLGFWLRANVDRAFEATAGGAVLRVMIGSDQDAAGGHRDGACRRGDGPRLAMPYVPPPPPTTTTGTTYSVDLNPPNITVPNIDVHVGGTIEVPKPQPFVVDVDLGAVFFGMQVRIDPRVLPFDRLRGAGWITVELSGPADALVSFQAQLSATLQRGSVRVDGWSNIATDASLVHARFTVWPPGSRP